MAGLRLTRDQLASFLNDFEQIKQFEKLFAQTNDNTDSIEGSLEISIGASFNAANEAAARIDALFQSLEKGPQASNEALDRVHLLSQLMGKEPTPEKNNSVFTDYIDLAENGPHVPAKRRLSWNPVDGTMNIGMDYGVVQQVGIENYVRVQNETGLTLANGTVVAYSSVGPGGVISVVPFIADGSFPAQYFNGVMTHDLPDSGETGYATVYGRVRELDTSAWSAGDILYASPTVAGEMTNVRPTAPDIVVILGVVLIDDATNGEIFLRPTYEIQTFYGSFVKTTDQTPAVINTAYALTWDSALIANGFSIGGTTSQIIADNAGLYSVTATVQIGSGNSSEKDIWVWFRKNGTDIANSARIVTSRISGGYTAISATVEVSMVANDYIEVMFAADDTAITIDAVAATAFAPAAAAATISIAQVAQ